MSKFADPPIEWSETKNVRWKVEIPGRGSASPVVWGDRIFVLSAVPVVWTLDRNTPYVPSPLLYDGILYLLKTNSGILSAFDAKTGKPHYLLQRLDGLPEVFSSPVGARGRVYFTGRDGVTIAIRNSSTFEVLAKNEA